MTDFTAWHGKSFAEHVALRDAAAATGYRFLSLSLYGAVGSPVYAAVMIKRATVVAQRDWPLMTSAEWQQTFNDQAKLGYGPVMIAATGSAADPRFAAVFQPMNPIPLTRGGLRSGDPADAGTIQGMNAVARKQGLMLHWAASYGDPADPRYAAIWVPVTDHSLWNADGVADTAAQYQARFNAQTSAWCRPSFVTLDAGSRYLSVFTDRETGPWIARHDMTPAEYQTEFDAHKQAGFYPVCVQAAGTSAANARFTALWVKTEAVTPRVFTPTGPVTNAAIDAIILAAMQASPVKHAGLAITHGTRLVYARGYTFAEADWPLAQPTTRFRMASVSKTVTAIAIRQLIDAGQLHLGDKLQDKLQLKTPSGGAPADGRFGSITIQHLLEHKSGVKTNNFIAGDLVQSAFAAAGHLIALPVTAEQTDAYVASLPLDTTPGATAVYNNCGYYLLARVVAKLRGTATPVAAFQQTIFAPLGIQHIGRAGNLVTAQPPGEARYQSATLALATSDMTNDRPLVPAEYGDEQLSIADGSGGLSGSPVDQARLIAALLAGKDTTMLKAASVVAMLDAGAAVNATGTRAGYGFDAITKLAGGGYRAQKGGSLQTSNNVLSFDGQWGLVMAWASPPSAADAAWYPYYDTVMAIAKSAAWGPGDLFATSYGMAPL
ncbi:serine hydrolase [Glacieibacterium megasporae]|uniref:serine hydrolase n=1 Tax=Glacieibacterium megasporae TaxID=2835787 RepID=UPI001C1E6932|nr:serine hydrolase [Polymorphobacter megasporae]UAJ11848.1 serine hydrolase [Polymorphobacter megasporae]